MNSSTLPASLLIAMIAGAACHTHAPNTTPPVSALAAGTVSAPPNSISALGAPTEASPAALANTASSVSRAAAPVRTAAATSEPRPRASAAPAWCSMAQPIGQLVVHSSKPRRPADLVPTQFSGADELLSGGEVMVDVIARGCQSSSSQLAMRQAAGLRKTAPDAWSFEGAMCYRVGAGALVPDCEPKVLHYSLGKLPAGKYVVRSGTLSASFEVPSLLEHGAVSAGDYMH